MEKTQFLVDWDHTLPHAGRVGDAAYFDPPTDNVGWWIWLDFGDGQLAGYPADVLYLV